MKKYLFLVLTTLLFLSSCVTNSIGSEQVMTFYMENTNIKYYVRPSKMLSINYDEDKASIIIDFTYQKNKSLYVSDAYTNFTLEYNTNSYIDSARFILENNESVVLKNISLLDRNVNKGYLRVSTILENEYLQKTLECLASDKAVLEIILETGEKKFFKPTPELIDKINEAFLR